jgi:pyridinium-3,5-biscarboxylic acid mononucleotide synthase
VNTDQLKELLAAVAGGSTSIEQAIGRLRSLPFEQLPFATVDHHRAIRCGHPEVIFCPGKAVDHTVEIARRLAAGNGRVLATRASAEQLAALRQAFPEALMAERAGVVLINPQPEPQVREDEPFVTLACAGTADLPVAEEAQMTLRSMNVPTRSICDVGVSGVHRLLGHVQSLQQSCAVVCVAGMEGALPSVVGGLVACPVFAVPTSIGYGANMGGITAMLAMLNSCASSVTVVNVDNGFGAAFSAALTYHQIMRFIQAKKA